MWLYVLYGEIEPLVIPQGVGIVLDEENIFLIFLVLVRAVQVAAFKAGVQLQHLRTDAFLLFLEALYFLKLNGIAASNVLQLYFIFFLDA